MGSPKHVTIAFIFLLSSAGPAWSGAVISIFQRSNQPEICRFENGVYQVDRMRLAQGMITASAIDPDLQRHAVPPGSAIGLLASNEPFGSGRFAATPPALAASQRLLTARMELTGFLALGGSRQEGYEVENRLARSPTSDDFFLRPAEVSIECIRLRTPQQQVRVDRSFVSGTPATVQPVAPPAPTSEVPNFAAAALAKRLLVRSEILELVLNHDQVSRSKGATFSFGHDETDKEDTFIGDGALGWRVWRYEGRNTASLVPFLNYKSTGKRETNLPEYIEPGIMIDASFHKEGFAAAVGGLTASRIIDDGDGSDQANLSAFLIPSFSLPFGPRPLFGGYIRVLGPMIIRPEIQLLAAARQIEDAGTNPALQGKDSYYGVGFNQRIDVMFTGVPLFQELRGYLEYRVMRNFGTRDADMFKAGVFYPIFGWDRLSLNFDYTDGRDLATLLEDTQYMLGLAFRY
ncbi:MAG TPA: hypothetical protein VFD26_08150 [Methyloceanibacter sp.]|nr:hypothetical protein [Methyloceanibacter sp.]